MSHDRYAEKLLALPITNEVVKYNRNGEEIAWLLIPEFRAFTTATNMFTAAKSHARASLQMPDKFDRHVLTGKAGGPVAEAPKDVGLTEAERLALLRDLVHVSILRRGREDNNTPRGTVPKVDGVL